MFKKNLGGRKMKAINMRPIPLQEVIEIGQCDGDDAYNAWRKELLPASLRLPKDRVFKAACLLFCTASRRKARKHCRSKAVTLPDIPGSEDS